MTYEKAHNYMKYKNQKMKQYSELNTHSMTSDTDNVG